MEVTTPHWRVISASVRGRSHIARGLACQDCHRVSVHPSGRLIVVVCDGAGSAQKAREGTGLVAKSSVEFLEQRLEQEEPDSTKDWEQVLSACLEHAQDVLSKEAMQSERVEQAADYTEFATTLLVTIVSRQWLAAMQIGDGAIVVRRASGALSVLTVPECGEYINETTFVTSSDARQRAHFHVEQNADVTGIAALSDGLQPLALQYADNTAYPPFFIPLFDFIMQSDSTETDLETFLGSDRVCNRTDDDTTLVLAVRPWL